MWGLCLARQRGQEKRADGFREERRGRDDGEENKWTE